MAFSILPSTPTSERPLGSRLTLCGRPNSGKTASLHTWPHGPDQKLHIMSYPGEKGHETIDRADPGIVAHVWDVAPDDLPKLTPHTVIQEIESRTWGILAGNYGPCHVFAGDGLHKLYGWYYQRALADLQDQVAAGKIDDEKAMIRAYGSPHGPGAHSDFILYLSKVAHSPVPYVVFTVWDDPEKDQPDNPLSKATHLFPALPGKLSQRLLGEFGVIYADVAPATATEPATKSNPFPQPPRYWQLKPGGKIWGAGLKMPVEIANRLPERIPQDFRVLQKVLSTAVQPSVPRPSPVVEHAFPSTPKPGPAASGSFHTKGEAK